MDEKDQTTDRKMSPSFFFLFDIKLRADQKRWKIRDWRQSLPGNGPSSTNYMLQTDIDKSMFRRSRRTAMACLAALAAQAPAGSVRDKPNEAGGAVAVNI